MTITNAEKQHTAKHQTTTPIIINPHAISPLLLYALSAAFAAQATM